MVEDTLFFMTVADYTLLDCNGLISIPAGGFFLFALSITNCLSLVSVSIFATCVTKSESFFNLSVSESVDVDNEVNISCNICVDSMSSSLCFKAKAIKYGLFNLSILKVYSGSDYLKRRIVNSLLLSSERVRKLLKLPQVLAYVPVEDVPDLFKELKKNLTDDDNKF